MTKGVAVAVIVLIAVGAAALFWPKTPRTQNRLDPALWGEFKTRFIESGRVIDDYNGRISHSEGQGYGMLLAEAAGDKAAFEALWSWSERVLMREDGLFSWRYEPCEYADRRCVSDRNNASDGEILIAWALLKAHRRWNEPAYLQAAKRIAEATLKLSTAQSGDRLFLLPGEQGFKEGDRLTLNGSYWIFPALEAFEKAFGDPRWNALNESGRWLIQTGRFGPYALPADWVDLEGQILHLSAKFPPRHGFDAVRILLHQAWSKTGVTPNDLKGYEALWQSQNPPPAWVSLDGDERAEYGQIAGMAAIAGLAKQQAKGVPNAAALPLPDENESYFSWALALLSRVAAAEKAQ